MCEVVTRKEQRFVQCNRERIAEAIAIVQPSGVSPFAKAAERRSGNFGMVGSYRNDLHGEAVQKDIELPLAGISVSSLHDDPSFDHGRSCDPAYQVPLQRRYETRRLALIPEQRKNSRRIQDH